MSAAPLSPDDVHLREATRDDAAGIVALWDDAGFLSYTPEPEWEVSAALVNPNARLLVADAPAAPAVPTGTVAATSTPGAADGHGREVVGVGLGTHDGRRGWVFRLAVARRARNLGAGRRLVRALEDWLADVGLPQVNLLVFDGNEGGREFWERLGYRAAAPVELRMKRLAP